MKKILLILTGGTICSFIGNDGFKDVDIKKAGPILIDNFRNSDSVFKNAEFEVIYPLDILSENMRIKDWNEIIQCYKGIDFSKYEGIIMTHGTDTLAYTAALLSLVLKCIGIPVIMVASQYPLNDKRANGDENFKNAVKLIKKGIKAGLYVVYRNDDNITYIHKGKNIKQCDNYSNDFCSKTMTRIEDYHLFEEEKGETLLNIIGELKNKVMVIDPYVGIDYESYNLSGKKIVLHGTFHSSTACTAEGESDILRFIKKCEESGVIFVLSPFQGELLQTQTMYSSTGKMLNAGAKAMPFLTKEYAFSKLVVASSLCQEKKDILEFIGKDLGDAVP